jgi:hypothetical protein
MSSFIEYLKENRKRFNVYLRKSCHLTTRMKEVDLPIIYISTVLKNKLTEHMVDQDNEDALNLAIDFVKNLPTKYRYDYIEPYVLGLETAIDALKCKSGFININRPKLHSYENVNYSTFDNFTPENKNGIWQIDYIDDTDFEVVEFKNGIKDGIYELYQEKELVLKGQFINGKEEGVWERYDGYIEYIAYVDGVQLLIPSIHDDDETFWKFKKVIIKGKKYRHHKKTGLILNLHSNVLVGYTYKENIEMDVIPERIERFARKVGLRIQRVK